MKKTIPECGTHHETMTPTWILAKTNDGEKYAFNSNYCPSCNKYSNETEFKRGGRNSLNNLDPKFTKKPEDTIEEALQRYTKSIWKKGYEISDIIEIRHIKK